MVELLLLLLDLRLPLSPTAYLVLVMRIDDMTGCPSLYEEFPSLAPCVPEYRWIISRGTLLGREASKLVDILDGSNELDERCPTTPRQVGG